MAKKLPSGRQAEILDYLHQHNDASILELAQALGSSESTVRRDLDQLATEGKVRRIHGGASLLRGGSTELSFQARTRENSDLKTAIGRAAYQLLTPGQTVIFDSSTTVFPIIEELLRQPIHLTAITHDVHLAASLALIPEINTIVPGGEIRRGSFTLVGASTANFYAHLHADVAFLGIHAISGIKLSEGGLAVGDMKRAIISAAERRILLADYSKFGNPALYEVGTLHDIHDLLTDRRTPAAQLDTIAAQTQTRVHIVQEEQL